MDNDTETEDVPSAPVKFGAFLKTYWDLLARYIRPQKRMFSLLAFLMACGIALKLVSPQIMRWFIDSALGGKEPDALAFAAAAFLGTAFLNQGISIFTAWLGETVAWTATNDLRMELAEHALSLDMGFHNDHAPGEMIERIDGDVTKMAEFFSQFALTLASNFILLIGILTVLFFESWRAGLAFTAFSAVTFLVMGKFRDIALKHHKEKRVAEAALFSFVEEHLSGTEDIRSSGAVGYSIRELYRHQGNVLFHDRKSHFKEWISESVLGFALTLGNVLAFASGYWLFGAGTITVGTVYLFIHYVNMLEEPFWEMTRQVSAFQTIGACAERLKDFKGFKPKVVSGQGVDISSRPAALVFDAVGFSYNDTDAVLKDVSFALEPGRVLGLLGRTGSGKTTVARLLFRLYDPSSGVISINEKNIKDATLQALRHQVAIVTQDVQLFKASLRDNLAFFDRSIRDEKIIAAIHDLELGDWYDALPGGLDTEMNSGSRGLSAGEAQLLAFTRVFLRDPGLVILDEASSRLDPATEQKLERVIDKLLAGRTAIVIAHRLETVDRADDILILERGEVAEYGNRKDLETDSGSRFHALKRAGLAEVLA